MLLSIPCHQNAVVHKRLPSLTHALTPKTACALAVLCVIHKPAEVLKLRHQAPITEGVYHCWRQRLTIGGVCIVLCH